MIRCAFTRTHNTERRTSYEFIVPNMECEIVDPNQLRLVEGQIETLVTSGKTQLEESVLKDLKKIMRLVLNLYSKIKNF